jgi:hypothetical protein
MNSINEIVSIEEEKLKNSSSPGEKINILHNLIVLKNHSNADHDNYQNIKKLIDLYIDNIKVGNYGYDFFNLNKIDEVLKYLKLEEQISALKYALSSIKRELPEYENNKIIESLNKTEIKYILTNRKLIHYPKALLLYSNTSINRLIIVLIAFIILVCIFLLPANQFTFSVFTITYEHYSDNFLLNHFLNILGIFADIDNDLKIQPLNAYGLLLVLFAKIVFVLFIINYIYRKLSDKISLK